MVDSSKCKAEILYVSTYSGSVQALRLTTPDDPETRPTLVPVGRTRDCGTHPSWLMLDRGDNMLYCVDEAWGKPKGAVYAFKPGVDQSSRQWVFELVSKAEMPAGPVSAELCGQGRVLGIAHYAAPAVSAWQSSRYLPGAASRDPAWAAGLLRPLDPVHIPCPKPGGPVTGRQEAPHLHQIVADPHANFALVPDLGADCIHILTARIQGSVVDLVRVGELALPAGSGPRHLAFMHRDNLPVYMYVVTELSNEILGFRVNYHGSDAGHDLSFTQVHKTSTHGPGESAPVGAAAAEILVSPDQKLLIVSSRFDNISSEHSASDVLISYSIDQDSGRLTLVGKTPSYGRNPRHMSLNREGDHLAVVSQSDHLVTVVELDGETGKLGGVVASVTVDEEPNCVVWA